MWEAREIKTMETGRWKCEPLEFGNKSSKSENLNAPEFERLKDWKSVVNMESWEAEGIELSKSRKCQTLGKSKSWKC